MKPVQARLLLDGSAVSEVVVFVCGFWGTASALGETAGFVMFRACGRSLGLVSGAVFRLEDVLSG